MEAQVSNIYLSIRNQQKTSPWDHSVIQSRPVILNGPPSYPEQGLITHTIFMRVLQELWHAENSVVKLKC